jgi:carbamoyl-phosphate synthase small subunit
MAQTMNNCLLALEDGTVFFGRGFGAKGTRTGEVVFNTAMTGYQEILTDPSYCGQIVTMTYPQIGNYGVNREDVEACRSFASGFVIKALSPVASNYRSRVGLAEYLAEENVIGIEGIDTRALTRKLRVDGAMRGVITTESDEPSEAVRLARGAASMVGADLVTVVAPTERAEWTEGLFEPFHRLRRTTDRRFRVTAIDCGMKRNILRHLVDVGCEVSIAPPTSLPEEVLAAAPDGVFVSNGPGDPAAVGYAVRLLEGLIGRTPIFGICLGHQLIARALGANTFKLKFGHRGANQPVENICTGRVEITSQNHGFAVDRASADAVGIRSTHFNLNDKTLEGFVHDEHAILAVQYHPEASPGPHDATYLFDCFVTMMQTRRSPTAEEMSAAQVSLARR